MLSAIKFAKYYELDRERCGHDRATDSMEMYGAALIELNEERGEFTHVDAAARLPRHLLGAGIDHVQELRTTTGSGSTT